MEWTRQLFIVEIRSAFPEKSDLINSLWDFLEKIKHSRDGKSRNYFSVRDILDNIDFDLLFKIDLPVAGLFLIV